MEKNVFDQLLESYDSLKKRKLSIKIDEGKYRGNYNSLPDELKREVDAKLTQEFGANLNTPSRSLPVANKDKKFYNRVQAYIFGDPKSQVFPVKFNHKDTGKEVILVHSDGVIDYDRLSSYRNQLAADIASRHITANIPQETGAQQVGETAPPEQETPNQGVNNAIPAGFNSVPGEGAESKSMIDSIFNSNGDIDTPDHHLMEIHSNILTLCNQKSFFIVDSPLLSKGDDESYPLLKNFILMEFGMKLMSAFGLQLNPINKTYLQVPLDPKDLVTIIKTLENITKRCIKLHEGDFLEEDAIWVSNRIYFNDFGVWITDPLFLNYSLFIENNDGLFKLLIESFNHGYQEWCNQNSITASYMIKDYAADTNKQVSKYNNDPYSLDLILPNVGSNIVNLFKERVKDFDNTADIAHFVAAYNTNLAMVKQYVNTFLTGQIITTNQVLDFEQLLATKLPQFSDLIFLIKPLLQKNATLKNTNNRFLIYSQPRIIKIGEKPLNEIPMFTEIQSIDKTFSKIKLQRFSSTELRKQSLDLYKDYVQKVSSYIDLVELTNLNDLDLEDDYVVSFVRETIKSSYIINKIYNQINNPASPELAKKGRDYICQLFNELANDYTSCFIINTNELLNYSKTSLKLVELFSNKLSGSRIFISPCYYLITERYITEGLVKSKLCLYIDYNLRDKVSILQENLLTKFLISQEELLKSLIRS